MSEDEIKQLKISGYKIVSYFSRRHHSHGGVAVAIEGSFLQYFFCRTDINNLSVEMDCEVCAAQSDVLEMIIITFYRPPSGDFQIFSNILHHVLNEIFKLKYQIFINGDFNVDFNVDNPKVCSLGDLVRSFYLNMLIKSNTRGSACLDNIFSNTGDHLAYTLDVGFSDHLAVAVEFNTSKKIESPIIKSVCRPITQAGLTQLMGLLQDTSWEFIDCMQTSTESKFEMFVTFIRNGIDLVFPEKTFSHKKNQPLISWFNDDLKRKRETLNFFRDLSRNSVNEHILSATRSYAKYYKAELMRAKRLANDRFIRDHNCSPKSVWDIVKRNSNICKEKSIIDSKLSPDQFNNFFTDVPGQIVGNLPVCQNSSENYVQDFVHMQLPNINKLSFKFSEITQIQVRDIVVGLKNTGGRDFYGLNTKILKTIINVIVGPLTKLFNLCIRDAVYPDVLKISRVTPIHKKGDVNELNNYRPISICPIFSKVFEKALKTCISDYFESNNLFNTSQFGFRTEKSTTMAINRLIEIINSGYDNGEHIAALFCDLSKAFDCVSFELLVGKLRYYKFCQSSVKLLLSYLQNRKQLVDLNGSLSGVQGMKYGVPQGSVLGPLLFLIYINDLGSSDPTAEFVLFADDTTVLLKSKDLGSLRADVGETQAKVTKWFHSNQLSLNGAKTELLVFSLRDVPDTELCRSVRFLGVQVDSRLDWNDHINVTAGKVASGIFALRSLVGLVSRQVILSVYYACVESKIAYAILSWGSAPNIKRLFSLQRRAIRLIGGVDYRADCKQMFIDFKILTVPCLYIFRCLLYVRENIHIYSSHEDFHD